MTASLPGWASVLHQYPDITHYIWTCAEDQALTRAKCISRCKSGSVEESDGCHGTLSWVTKKKNTHTWAVGMWPSSTEAAGWLGYGERPDQVFLQQAVCTVIPHWASSQLMTRPIELQGLIKPHYGALFSAPIEGLSYGYDKAHHHNGDPPKRQRSNIFLTFDFQ